MLGIRPNAKQILEFHLHFEHHALSLAEAPLTWKKIMKKHIDYQKMFGKCRNHQGLSAIMRRIGGCLLLSNSVSVRLWSLCRIISLYRELRHLCRGKVILLRWEEFLDQIEECLQVSGDSPRNWHLYSIVTCSFHNNLILQAY